MPVEQKFGVVTVVSRERITSQLTIVAGDTYSGAAGQYVTVRVQDDTLPDLSDATLTFTAKHKQTGTTITGIGELVTQEPDEVEINVSITSTERRRASFRRDWLFDVQAEIAPGVKRTIAGPQARCRVLLDQTF
ncbi:hypothetical protein Pan44_28310 [Caulifigura coniformis]|uniref:Uncharacterized protein n=1 Tax=Caulifigura coniformis TaxID=2527983 RepID=A0A517SF85_9PLAN|nr:hypothetical protein [Caulifigura coniformis]QDT54793.1 hypothetical protein Pan44_28310 [Caulifigura coniformis]